MRKSCTKIVVALSAIALSSIAAAQVTPGLPVQPLNPPSAPAATQQAPASRPALTPQEQQTIAGLTGPAPQSAASTRPAAIHAPPPTLTVKPGVTTIFGIARSQTNRLVVPFRTPAITTSSAADISVDPAGVVYVKTDSNEPVSLFIYDKPDPTLAIAVSMVPADIPPVSVQLRVPNYYPRAASEPEVTRAGDRAAARGWETEQPFTETVKGLFRTLALGKVPDGYSFGKPDAGSVARARCDMPGLTIEPMQLMTGYNMLVVVSRVTNLQPVAVDVVETGCRGDDVIAAAAWPAVRLRPGQATELYVAIRAQVEDVGSESRPVLVREGR
ncbi:TraK domain-containing protein [Rhodanobacter denitrificans]|uniref:TraK domain-containing protein n=1 Tax=Rhodanobacter denitrificans TaxID=666685 RepID=UPI001F232FDA|nr:type-F conjugative transfer system secretin TraK [Rhodanobacter denitrificans]UJJ60578.1 type-F conjugative transfer system secretin TraK [Rhodanobacter denitrificans]